MSELMEATYRAARKNALSLLPLLEYESERQAREVARVAELDRPTTDDMLRFSAAMSTLTEIRSGYSHTHYGVWFPQRYAVDVMVYLGNMCEIRYKVIMGGDATTTDWSRFFSNAKSIEEDAEKAKADYASMTAKMVRMNTELLSGGIQ